MTLTVTGSELAAICNGQIKLPARYHATDVCLTCNDQGLPALPVTFDIELEADAKRDK